MYIGKPLNFNVKRMLNQSSIKIEFGQILD